MLWFVVALIISSPSLPICVIRTALLVSAWTGLWLPGCLIPHERFIFAPVTEIAVRLGERWIPAGDEGIGGAVGTAGRLTATGARLPVVPLVILAAVILTLVVGLVAPGVFR